MQGGWSEDAGWLEQRCRVAEQRQGVAEQRQGVAGAKTRGG